jgi:hypothetical protein
MTLNEMMERDGLIKVERRAGGLEVYSPCQPTDEQLEAYRKEMLADGRGLVWKRYTNGNISYQSAPIGSKLPFGKWPHEIDPSHGTPV